MMLRVFVFILAMVFLGIFVNWYWGKIFVAGESQKHPEELLSNETKVLLVLLQDRCRCTNSVLVNVRTKGQGGAILPMRGTNLR